MERLERNDLQENIAVIKINKSYNENMSALELYDITRGCWKRKLESVQLAEYVLAVVYGVVKEVYHVERWVPASKLNRETIPYDGEREKGRIGFFGTVAEERIKDKYIGKSVADLFKRGEADPVKLFLKDAKEVKYKNSINIPQKPILIIQTDDEPIVVCSNCECSFVKAPRCPECGQLIDYGKEKWNKPKLQSLEEWERASSIENVTAKQVTNFVNSICEFPYLSYHIGAVDISLDMIIDEDMKPLQIMMLFGKGKECAFQPKVLLDYTKKHKLSKECAECFFESMKSLLSVKQKNKPYERENGYYYIDYTTIINEKDKIINIINELYIRLRG